MMHVIETDSYLDAIRKLRGYKKPFPIRIVIKGVDLIDIRKRAGMSHDDVDKDAIYIAEGNPI